MRTSIHETETPQPQGNTVKKTSIDEFEERFEQLVKVFQFYLDEVTNAGFSKKKMKNALYCAVLQLHQKCFPYDMVLEASFEWFDKLNPEYILEACTNIYSNPFLTHKINSHEN